METVVYYYLAWSVVLFGAIIVEEILTWKRVETSEQHSRLMSGFSGGLYGRVSSASK